MEEYDFYFSKEQQDIQYRLLGKKNYCFFKGQPYTECATKGHYENNKNNFKDCVYLGSGFDSDITIKHR